MVRSEPVIVDVSGLECGPELFTHQEIVNTPAHISLTGFELIIPPGIFDLLRMKMAKGVNKSRIDEVVHSIDLSLGVA